MASKFRVGDLVWAKMKGFPAWPGKVIEPKPEVKRPSNKKPMHFIFFYGSENYAWVFEENTFLYATNKDKFMPASRIPKGFKEAVEAIDEALEAMPTQMKNRQNDLPSIDEELATIFPERPEATKSAHRDYTREPLTGKTKKMKRKRLFKNHERRSPSPVLVDGEEPPVETAADDAETPEGATEQKMPRFAESVESGEMTAKNATARKKNELVKKAIKHATASQSGPSPKKIKLGTPRKSPKKPRMPSVRIPSELTTRKPQKNIIPTPCKIGFLGLGIMGSGMVRNLLKSGHEVTVWNRTIEKCKDFAALGALPGETPCDVVQSCDIIFSSVANPAALKDLVFGNCGVLQGISPGKSFVDMSSVDVETITDINEAITMRNGRFLEAPVFGSKEASEDGQLVVLAAGDRDLYDDCLSCFEAIGRKTYYLGEIGNGARMRLVLSMVLGTVIAGLSEGMALAGKVGLHQEDLLEILSLSSLNCSLFRSKGYAMMENSYNPRALLQNQQKDMRLSLNLGDEVDQPLAVAAAANEMYKKAKARGYGTSDVAAVFRAADI
ncbi:glyoxylate/succinic semialdehyde reductase 1 isoform X2 [Lingula anatina]|uniref:Cytokine-like nuclear factor N-PAC n=1 Tax=Lingula anatina TaxID=7574 RepID=A0A1S3HMW1_LINAN|nr:glyoxylate/succinic semialdehyde reductase 1 isoform X2 [Lingula anatina]|eukprot:XP_013387400.1 glyoxylate/succinic semialdehyde reductase 1 isoform X2 [Lingula anatina]